MAHSRNPVHLLLHSRVHRLRPSAAGRRVGRRTGGLLRRGSHADSNRGRVLRLGCSQSHVVRGGAQDHPGGCGTRRLGRGGDRRQCRPRSAFPLAHRGGRSPRLLHRQLGKSHADIGPERLRMGRLRVDFVPAGDACHGLGVRAVAGPADLERAVRGRGRCRHAWLARRHHLGERRILGTGRRLFAVRLARHLPGVGPGREWGALDSQPCYSQWMVSQRGAVLAGDDHDYIEKGEYMPKLNWKLLTKKRGSSTQGLPPGKDDLAWVTNTVTLIYGERDAVLVDTFLSVQHSKELVDWVAESGKNLIAIYVTHAHGDHFFGLKLLLDRFPNARAFATASSVAGMQNQIDPDFIKSFWEPRFPGQVPSQLTAPEILEGDTLHLEGEELRVIA